MRLIEQSCCSGYSSWRAWDWAGAHARRNGKPQLSKISRPQPTAGGYHENGVAVIKEGLAFFKNYNRDQVRILAVSPPLYQITVVEDSDSKALKTVGEIIDKIKDNFKTHISDKSCFVSSEPPEIVINSSYYL